MTPACARRPARPLSRIRSATMGPATGWWQSRSLKLFLGAFRNHGAFPEDCTVGIGLRLVQVLAPRWRRLGG